MLDASSGRVSWSVRMPKPIFASPLWYDQETFIIADVNGYVSSLSANEKGKIQWQFKADGPIFSSPRVLLNSRIFFGSHDHQIYCLDGKNGGSLLWRTKLTAPVYSSPAFYQSINVVVCDTQVRIYQTTNFPFFFEIKFYFTHRENYAYWMHLADTFWFEER